MSSPSFPLQSGQRGRVQIQVVVHRVEMGLLQAPFEISVGGASAEGFSFLISSDPSIELWVVCRPQYMLQWIKSVTRSAFSLTAADEVRLKSCRNGEKQA